jgi:hypothetical protein
MPLHLLVKEGLLSRDLLLSPNLLLSLNIHYYQRFHCPFLAYSYSSLVRQSGYYSITQGKLVNPIKSCFLRLRRRSGTCIDCPSKNVFPRLKFNKGLPFEAAWVFHLGLFFFSIRCASARRMAGLPESRPRQKMDFFLHRMLPRNRVLFSNHFLLLSQKMLW